MLRVRYPDGYGGLRDILQHATAEGFVIHDVQVETIAPAGNSDSGQRMVEVTPHIHGKRPVNDLAASLSDLENVQAVLACDANAVTGE